MSRADMESASPRRHTMQAAVFKPEELSALCGVGGTQLAMMVDQARRKGPIIPPDLREKLCRPVNSDVRSLHHRAMPLFKYMTIDAAEHYFSNSMLKASRPQDFNDVLDAYPVLPSVPAAEVEEWARTNTDRRRDQGTLMQVADRDAYEFTYGYELQQAQRVAREERTYFNELYRQELYRFVCFCRSGRHPLMWTHYAKNHEGIQLEFDEQHECFQGRLHNVAYVEERPILTLSEMRQIATHANDPDRVAPSFFFHKALEWSYEQEVRLCLRRDETVLSGSTNPISLYSVPFTALRSVTFGSRSYQADLNLQDAVSSVLEREKLDVKTYKLRVSATEYRLEKQETRLLRRAEWERPTS